MLVFTVIKPRHTFERQWSFLLKKIEDDRRDMFKKVLIGLLICTALYLFTYFVAAPDDYIVFKAVGMFMIVLFWFALMVIYAFWTLNIKKGRRRLRHFLDSILDIQLNYSVEIDNEKVTIIGSGQSHEFIWEEFFDFGIIEETLYVFNSVNRLNSLYWDKAEIGDDAYLALLDILKQKAIKRAF